MGQIVGLKAKPKRCNLNKLSQLGTPAAGEYILVSYDNSMTANGQGNFDRYIMGDGRTAATALELKYLDDSTHPYIVEEVNRAVADIQPIEITGDVTNAPDEEDLTSENQGGTDVLKFKDKAYNAALYSGLGRVYLRKNIVTLEGTGKNILTQAMLNTANTIYHIQYDYDLNGETITLPAKCVLEFDGGSLKNGKLIGTFTIISQNVCLFDVDITGATLKEVRSEWFSIQSGVDSTSILNNILNANTNNVEFISYSFPLLVSAPSTNDTDGQRSCVKITRGGRSIDFRGNTIQIIANDLDKYNIVEIYANELELKNLNVVGDVSTHTGTTGEQGHGIKISIAHDVVIDKCSFNECWGDGIDIIERGEVYPYNITLRNCKAFRNRRQGLSIEGGRDLYIKECEFAYTGTLLSTNPSFGVDVEPWEDGEASKVIGLVFEDCSVHDNTGNGEMALQPCWHHAQEYNSEIRLTRCRIYNNSERKLSLYATRVHDVIIDDSTFGTEVYNAEATIRNSQNAIINNSFIFGCIHFNNTTNFNVNDTQITRDSNTITTNIDGSGDASNCPIYTKQSYGKFSRCKIQSLYQLAIHLWNSAGNTIEFVDSKINHDITSTNAVYLTDNINVLFTKTELRLMGGISFHGIGQIKFKGCLIQCTANYLLSLYDGHNSDVDYDYIFEESVFASVNAIVITNTLGKLGYFDVQQNAINYGSSANNNYVIWQRTHGTSAQRPVFTNGTFYGYKYYDEDINKTIFWNGVKWVDSEGYTAARSFGTNSQIPSNLGVSDAGFVYYSQDANEYLFWQGTYFADKDGNVKGYAYDKDITADFERGKYHKVTGSGTNMALSQTTSPDNRFSTILCDVHAGDLVKVIGVAGSSPRLYVLASGYNAGEVIEAEPANGVVPSDAFVRFVKVPSDCILAINCYNDAASPKYYNTSETPFSAVIYSNTAFE